MIRPLPAATVEDVAEDLHRRDAGFYYDELDDQGGGYSNYI